MRIGLGLGISTGRAGAFGVTPSNPAPTATNVAPSQANAGGGDTTLTITGTNFVNSSVVRDNGANLATTYVSPTQLTAVLPAASLASAGTRSIDVQTPAPGGGTSTPALTFTVANPAPVASSVAPSSATAGSNPTLIAVTGTGFVSTSVIRDNGANLATTFISATELRATLPSGSLATAGTRSIDVVSPAPGGGTSAAVTFTVANPVPSTTSVSPLTIVKGSGATPITVTGSNFVATSAIRDNASALGTVVNSSTSLSATLPAGSTSTAGTRSIDVRNPTPGGGTSSPALSISIVEPAPVLTSMSATSGERWFAPRSLTLSGSNLDNATVAFGAVSGIAPTANTSTSITFNIPDAELDSVATKNVTVTTAGGTSNALTYSVVTPANLASGFIADANRVTLNVTAVSQWANEVTGDANKTASQATALNQPTFNASDPAYNNKGTVSFAGTPSQWMKSGTWTTARSQPGTTVVIGQHDTTATCFFIDGNGSTNRNAMGAFTANQLGIFGGTANVSQSGASGTGLAKAMFVAEHNGASSKGYRGSATPVISGNPGSGALGGRTLGASYVPSNPMIGKLRAVLDFNGLLTTTQRDQLAAWANRDSGGVWA